MDRQMQRNGRTGTLLIYLWVFMVLVLWASAFFPVPAQSAEWILKAQAACFGTLSNGLPAAHGWLLLILSPLAILSVLWASHAEELGAAFQFIKASRMARYLGIGLLLFLMLDAHWVGVRLTYASRIAKLGYVQEKQNPLPEEYPRQQKPAPEFRLLNQQGQFMTQENLRGKVTILTFAFAHCSSICPFIIKDALSAQQRIASPHVQTIIISIDPWRDTPSTLPAMAKSWGIKEKSFLLTEQPSIVAQVLEKYQIKTVRNEKDGQINHAGQTMLVDRHGKIAYSFLNPSSDWIVTAAVRLLNE